MDRKGTYFCHYVFPFFNNSKYKIIFVSDLIGKKN